MKLLDFSITARARRAPSLTVLAQSGNSGVATCLFPQKFRVSAEPLLCDGTIFRFGFGYTRPSHAVCQHNSGGECAQR